MTVAAPAPRVLRVAMNGVTGRMGYRQHLLRSILPLREAAGLHFPDGSRVQGEPILVGRNEAKLRDLAQQHKIEHWTTDLDGVIADRSVDVLFDASMTSLRAATLRKAMRAGKHVLTEKPTAETLEDAVDLARVARDAGITAGVVHDKLYLPGLVKLRRLAMRASSAGSCRCGASSATGCSRGETQPAQRPSWNYRKE